MKPSLSILFISLLFFACGPGQAADQKANDAAAEQTPPPSEDELMMRLASEMEANAETQAKIDRNVIINYAMENFLDIKATPSGLYYQILAEGVGDLLKTGDHVLAHYQGAFQSGTIFQSSINQNKPIAFYIGKMIPGWNEGLQLTRPGGKIRLLIPSALGYGAEGLKVGEKFMVPPNEVLIFDVEVLEKLK